jgi:ubiquinone/menaquinone biosynthesis C-methylase UbiE
MSAFHAASVGQQFDRQVAHYLADSAMADRTVLQAVLAVAPVRPGQRVLDVACGAGFLLHAYRAAGAEVVGVDVSAAMLREAHQTLGPSAPPGNLVLADAARLPFAAAVFDVVTCKLAFHYFPHPMQVVAEMARVCRPEGLITVIDRVASEDPVLYAAHNRLEKVRTPNKIRVYPGSELAGLLERSGLTIVRRDLLVQPMDFDEWMAAAGATERAEQARALLLGPGGEDLTGLAPREEGGRLQVQHRTLILVGKLAWPAPPGLDR